MYNSSLLLNVIKKLIEKHSALTLSQWRIVLCECVCVCEFFIFYISDFINLLTNESAPGNME